jgi:ABC-2 type transport system ATP-binding protein
MPTGNRQKGAILCAQLHEPQLVLRDEPSIGLDIETVSQLKKLIFEQSRYQGRGFLITSHDLNFIDVICDRVIMLSNGGKVFDGSLATLKHLVH